MNKVMRVVVSFSGDIQILFCQAITECKIKQNYLILSGCSDFSIEEDDGSNFIVDAISIPGSSLLSYSVGHIEEVSNYEKLDEDESEKIAIEEELKEETKEETPTKKKKDQVDDSKVNVGRLING